MIYQGQTISKVLYNGQQVSKGLYNGQSVYSSSPNTLYYTNGVEDVAWVEGSTFGDLNTKSKNADHLYLKSEDTTQLTSTTYVTNVLVDLTNITTLYVEWENTGSANNNNLSYLIASTVKGGAYGSFNAQLESKNTFVKNVKTLNVSTLTGNHHIRVHTRAAAIGVISELKVYRVWGE